MKIKQLIFIIPVFATIFSTLSMSVSAVSSTQEKAQEYLITVELNGLSIKKDSNPLAPNDQNIFGKADVLFRYNIDSQSPDLEEHEGMTTDTVKLGSGESVTFDPATSLHSYKTCICDQEIKSFITVYDYAPIKSTLKGLFRKGVSLTGSYVTTGPIGVAINLIGEALSWIGEQISVANLSDEEKQAYKAAQVISNSDVIGITNDTGSITCQEGTKTIQAKVEKGNDHVGDITYMISVTPTGNECEEPSDTGMGDESDEGDNITDYNCDETTGKVRVKGEYVCPTSSVPSGDKCECITGYEWAYLDKLCEGCTKTDKNKCLEALKTLLDEGGIDIYGNVSFVGETFLMWNMGPASCKDHEELLNYFADLFIEHIPDYNSECTNLEYSYVVSAPECGAHFYFKYLNKYEDHPEAIEE